MEKHYSAYFFDLGGTLLVLEQDEIACSETRKGTLLPGVRDHLTLFIPHKLQGT